MLSPGELKAGQFVSIFRCLDETGKAIKDHKKIPDLTGHQAFFAITPRHDHPYAEYIGAVMEVKAVNRPFLLVELLAGASQCPAMHLDTRKCWLIEAPNEYVVELHKLIERQDKIEEDRQKARASFTSGSSGFAALFGDSGEAPKTED